MSAPDLTQVPTGTGVFLDANIFVYALLGESRECQQILQRCIQQEIYGVTTLSVISDVTHKLMLAEACATGLIASRLDWKKLRRNPDAVMRLSRYWRHTLSILGMNLLVTVPELSHLHGAQSVRATHGLMTGDSLIVAAMQHSGISVLLSRDDDFDHVAGLRRYAPSDLPSQS